MTKDLCFDVRNARHRVEIQSPSDTPDAVGGVDRTWNTYATVYAAIRPKSAVERRIAAQAELTVSHEIEIRHRSDVEHEDRIKFGSRLFSVVGIRNPLERDVVLRIDALEKTPTTAVL